MRLRFLYSNSDLILIKTVFLQIFHSKCILTSWYQSDPMAFCQFYMYAKFEFDTCNRFREIQKTKMYGKNPSITIGLNGIDSKMFCKLYLDCQAFLYLNNQSNRQRVFIKIAFFFLFLIGFYCWKLIKRNFGC